MGGQNWGVGRRALAAGAPGPAGGGGGPGHLSPAQVREHRAQLASPEWLVAQWSPDAGDIFPLDFLIIEKLFLPTGLSSQRLGSQVVCGDDSRGASRARKSWFTVWFFLSSKAGDDEKFKKVLTNVSDEPRPPSEPHLEVEEGRHHKPQVLGCYLALPGEGRRVRGLLTVVAPLLFS